MTLGVWIVVQVPIRAPLYRLNSRPSAPFLGVVALPWLRTDAASRVSEFHRRSALTLLTDGELLAFEQTLRLQVEYRVHLLLRQGLLSQDSAIFWAR